LLGVEARPVGMALADALCDLRTNALTEGLHDLGRRALSLLNYTIALVLQLRKNTENFSQVSRVVILLVAPTWLPFDGISSCQFPEGWIN
jgi:hypothetical protein